jgi:hypothetical protein
LTWWRRARWRDATAIFAALVLAWLALMAFASADDDYCATVAPARLPEGSTIAQELSLWPPGSRCVYRTRAGDVLAGSSWWPSAAFIGVAALVVMIGIAVAPSRLWRLLALAILLGACALAAFLVALVVS